MTELFYGVALLACPLGMGAMMWMMMRSGGQHAKSAPDTVDDVAALRSEVESLRADQRPAPSPADRTQAPAG